MNFDRQESLVSPTGATLNLYVRETALPGRGIVQINHGLAEHAARYGRFAGELAEAGFHVYAHDHRGHGRTTAPDAPPRSFGRHRGAEKVARDVAAVHDLITERHPGLPVIVFGHSMGAIIALYFAVNHAGRADALALWNVNVTADTAARSALFVLAWERFRLGSDAASRAMPRLTFQRWGASVSNARTPFDWLSHDPEQVERYIADPLCGWEASVAMWQDIFRMSLSAANPKALQRLNPDMPVHLVGGRQDPATSGGRAVKALEERMRRRGMLDVTCVVYPRMRHETLNETDRATAVADFIAWARRVCER
jgi:alpha-beta hydrolase superfamily lysophospholipase